MDYLPRDDGLTHLNVYSKAKTLLGRLLSNFANTPVDLGVDGCFKSIEGYWYWLGLKESDPLRDMLREAVGGAAKALGRKLRAPDWAIGIGDDTNFREKIEYALRVKTA